MKKYFLSYNDESLGPFTIDELKQKKINNKTLIWTEELPNWVTAENILELKDVYDIDPPINPLQKAYLKESAALNYALNRALPVWFCLTMLIFLLLGGFKSDSDLAERYNLRGGYTYTETEMRVKAIFPAAMLVGSIPALATLFFVYRFKAAGIVKNWAKND